MVLTIISRNNVVIIINIIFIVFFDYNYERRKLEANHKRSSSVFIALKHRFLKEKNNVTSVSYFLNKTNISLISLFFITTRLDLTCFDKDIYFYINVFFLCTYFLLT